MVLNLFLAGDTLFGILSKMTRNPTDIKENYGRSILQDRGPSFALWYSLALNIRETNNIKKFKCEIKTFLFSNAFNL